jgi:hypothetical protein
LVSTLPMTVAMLPCPIHCNGSTLYFIEEEFASYFPTWEPCGRFVSCKGISQGFLFIAARYQRLSMCVIKPWCNLVKDKKLLTDSASYI